MRLIDLQTHFSNNGVIFAFRREDMMHDVFKNPKNNKLITVPKQDDEVPEDFAEFACHWLGIENSDGTPYRPSSTLLGGIYA